MKSITINGQKRESVGKKSTNALRNAELVPCVAYGEGEPLHFSTHEKSFKDLVYTADAHTVQIQLNSGEKLEAILQDIQFHPVTDKILHADFYQLRADKPIAVEVPVRTFGRAEGVVVGGALRVNMRKLRVKAIPANLPDDINIDVTPLIVGGKIYVEALRNDKYTILHPDNAVVVAVRATRNVAKGITGAEETEEEN